ncbi:MAG: extracellular solute-binding protein [Pseudomonadota bacterium]
MGVFSRRAVLQAASLAALTAPLAGLPHHQARALPAGRSHGLSIFGDLKYPVDFAHFDYVRPDAPKGGILSKVPAFWAFNQNPNTFDTLNTFILRGNGPVNIEIIFDSLMVRAFDEPDAVYGLVASDVDVAASGNEARFFLRPEARWHDGSPLTAADPAFTFQAFKEDGHPIVRSALTELAGAEAISDHELALTFTGNQSRDLPQVIAALPIVSAAYYSEVAFDETTMTPPLASGPYKIGRVDQGTFIEYDRVEDYWGRDLPVNVGRHNFDRVRFEFYRDRDVAFEAFKAGEYMFREEFTSRVWATGYDFPAANDGRVVRETVPDGSPSGAQGWFINTRREKFADIRVRDALIYAFDFEWTNATLFFGLYERTASFFENSPLKAEGLPSDEELALLEPFRGQIPDECFGEPFVPPVSDGSGQDRRLMRQANQLLGEAGFEIVGGQRQTPDGAPFEIEFLASERSFERIVQPYIRNLERLGIAAAYRLVDAAQFQNRVNSFDFDLMVQRYSMAPTPGDGIKRFWTSPEAEIQGSRNLPGIADPAIDALTEMVIAAESRDAQITAARALDRVLRAGRYWVPQWYNPAHNLAYWDAYGRPETKPPYNRAIVDTWWYDADKAERIGKS